MNDTGSLPPIAVDRLSVRFGTVTALDDVSFAVPRRSISGLIGRNGAGKSTSIRCVAGILRPTAPESRISVLGLPPADDRRPMLARTGFLLSEPALFRYLTPIETLTFIGRAYHLTPREAECRAVDLVEFFDLGDAADRVVDNFSTGMQKRLALACALVHAPAVLVLDEPFEALDPLMVRSLKKLLKDYAESGGTVLLSSHLLDAVEEICDRVVFLERGRVVAAGATDEVHASLGERMPPARLEDLYASLVATSATRRLDWLIPG